MDRYNARDHCVLPADSSSVGRKMRLGHQRLDMGFVAYRKPAADDLLHRSRRGLAERCAGEQHCIDRYDDRTCPAE
jgi:hypothetical protein